MGEMWGNGRYKYPVLSLAIAELSLEIIRSSGLN